MRMSVDSEICSVLPHRNSELISYQTLFVQDSFISSIKGHNLCYNNNTVSNFTVWYK